MKGENITGSCPLIYGIHHPELVQPTIGVYAINVNLFKMCQLPTTFS